MRVRFLCVVLALTFSGVVVAQTEDVEIDAAAAVAGLVTAIEAAFDCEIETHGTPQFDSSANSWLVAFSATGDDCDDAANELAERGKSSGATFYRRPNSSEIRVLSGRIVSDVRNAFHCNVEIRGTPSFNEQSTYWSVSFSALGSDCSQAEIELRRRAREYQIVFLPIRTNRSLLR